jgi:MOSC domain-containing protein YiiM
MTAVRARVVSIYVAPAGGAPMEGRSVVRAVPGRGLEGDRYFDGAGAFSARAVPGREITELTLIEAEVIDKLQRDWGIDAVAADSRRNIVTSGIELNELVGTCFRVGEVRLLAASLCEPCVSLVKSPANRHLLRGLAHKGGLRARILSGGAIALGDAIEPEADLVDRVRRVRELAEFASN